MWKSPNTSLSFRYNANNEELEELYEVCEDDPPTPQFDVSASPSVRSENASPKRGDKTSSILDKYFKSIRTADKQLLEKVDKQEDKGDKQCETKSSDENRTPAKDVSSSPMKEYLNRLGKRSVSETTEVKDVGSNETWKLFHDFKFKIAQAVEDMKTRSLEETKEKSVPRDSSISDSEENSAIKDSDQSIGDTDNQVSSLNSSIQNLSELTQPLTAKATERETSLPYDNKNCSDSSDDTQKNLVHSETAELTKDILSDPNMEVESGIEALEDGIDGFGDTPQPDNDCPSYNKPIDFSPSQPLQTPASFGSPPGKANELKLLNGKPKKYFLTFPVYFLTFLLFINYILFPEYNIWNGFLLGLWSFYLGSIVKQWLTDTYFGEWEPYKGSFFQLKRSSAMPITYTIPSVKEHRPLKKYEGWINHYRYPEYDPFTYGVNKTTTAFMKLEGCHLRISYTKAKIMKRAIWDEKIEKVDFYQHRLYNLTGSKVTLLPKGLVKRRQWSKKYPICVILNENEKIQVLEKESSAPDKKSDSSEKKKEQQSQHDTESAETNTSPEKKKKFVWRRREKSNPSHTECEPGKEGLRHRLVRKMHRDKKTDSVSTCTDAPEAEKPAQPEEPSFHDAETDLTTKSNTSTKDDPEEEIDETELTRIKEFLEETELEPGAEGTSEGEWSLHIKQSRDKHACLFLFARTGRDKHEWFRRLLIAANEANTAVSGESSAAEEKTASESAAEGKEGIEMAVYKLTEKETVAFGKSPAQKSDLDGPRISSASHPLPPTLESYEKSFWPFLLKIIQTKAGAQSSCQCRVLPAEMTWVNTILARLIYDITRNPIILARLQTRIQKKLHTLKLPSFMSPLMVTDLSLAGACPLVERVWPPSWDERGVWLDADLRYDGGAYISILTQINLMKLKEKNVTLEDQLLTSTTSENLMDGELNPVSSVFLETLPTRRKPAVYDSEVEDSAESSEDDESPPLQPVDSSDHLPSTTDLPVAPSDTNTAPASSKKKFLRMVDKIATNKYFQQVTDYKYVKRAMEGLSNTDIKLQVEVHGLEGRLALNLPPPPHDRIWVGFRTNPQLVLKARPAVGARTLRFAHISNWIEQKLSKEFEKILVLPNMEDIIIDVMTPTPVDLE
ncbi:testis-expressed protein 2 isoform X2 [Pectinophora gossypiella]|uniref:testis-expressed protein 2 isoform X2 n=1 Tax=Pectinophora gossypiella TaxID=13191 RepID=UPI00214DFCC4|nr:testis-expressed protein 2 isoform X2 [Pectinophora gossypiella]